MLCQKFIIQIARHSIKSTDILKEDIAMITSNSYIIILNVDFDISSNSRIIIEIINIPTLLFLEYLGMMQSDIKWAVHKLIWILWKRTLHADRCMHSMTTNSQCRVHLQSRFCYTILHHSVFTLCPYGYSSGCRK